MAPLTNLTFITAIPTAIMTFQATVWLSRTFLVISPLLLLSFLLSFRFFSFLYKNNNKPGTFKITIRLFFMPTYIICLVIIMSIEPSPHRFVLCYYMYFVYDLLPVILMVTFVTFFTRWH